MPSHFQVYTVRWLVRDMLFRDQFIYFKFINSIYFEFTSSKFEFKIRKIEFETQNFEFVNFKLFRVCKHKISNCKLEAEKLITK